MAKKKILYITYDGLLDPLGYSQVWEYLAKLSSTYAISIISFEKDHQWRENPLWKEIEMEAKELGITLMPMRYHKRFSLPATLYDISRGILRAISHIKKEGVCGIHARGYVTALMAMIAAKITGTKWVFDIRGFWPDEKADGGHWSRDGAIYKVYKWLEKKYFRNCDAVVTLTDNSRQYMKEHAWVSGDKLLYVIPTCTNLDRFKCVIKEGPRHADKLCVGYLGSAVYHYLFEHAVAFYRALFALRKDVYIKILTAEEDHAYVRSMMAKGGFTEEQYELDCKRGEALVKEIQTFDLCAFFIRKTFSKKAANPTKIGELLACGIPCVTNNEVGDVEAFLENEKVGVLVKSFEESHFKTAAQSTLALLEEEGIRRRCQQAAHKQYDLGKGVEAYRRLYEELWG